METNFLRLNPIAVALYHVLALAAEVFAMESRCIEKDGAQLAH